MEQKFRFEHLVIQTAFLGDLLLGIPFYKQLRILRPEDKITLFCRKGFGEFLKLAGLVDEVIEADKSSKENWAVATARLKERQFELLFCPHESFRSLQLAFSLKAKQKTAYTSWLGFIAFHHLVRRPLELPEALRQLALLEPLNPLWKRRLEEFALTQNRPGGQAALGKLTAVPSWADMSVARLTGIRDEFSSQGGFFRMSERARLLATELDLKNGQTLFLAPGSVWPTKMWTTEGFADVAREFLKRDFRVVLIGAPNEVAICTQIMKEAPGSVSIAGRTSLFELAELLALATVLVCNDSGAMHMAAAAGIKTVSLFGPTVLELGYRPWQNFATVVEVPRTELPCRPCGKHGAVVCPIGSHACMRDIGSQKVVAAIDGLISSSR